MPGAGDARRGPAQLFFDLAGEPRYGEADFLISPANRAAFEMIGRWPDWPDSALLLVGPPGSGKTHLGAIFARRNGAILVAPGEIPEPGRLAGATVLLDGLEEVADETALFHLMNFIRESGGSMLISSRRPPSALKIALPDLLSRLRRAPVLEIGAPDDSLIRAVLEKLFRDRQLAVEATLVDYVALRLERSLEAARAFVRMIDEEALARGRPVTRALAGELLQLLDASRGA
ncbi:MAG TPA: DnaA/Hda family protein [Methylosinus sp.]|jgi:chromosomal replication initiation ATPase DnaA|uniref:DnaA ATPase domain-containing protein n=1 Tax=Hyphomicrobiales TaxID=356 RepID=UPI002F94F2A4